MSGIWNWKTICTELEGINPPEQDIPDFEVTPGIMAISKSPNFTIIFQGEPPGSDARAIIWVKKVINYVDFVIKFFGSPRKIGENKVGVKIDLFFPHHCNLDLKIFRYPYNWISVMIGGKKTSSDAHAIKTKIIHNHQGNQKIHSEFALAVPPWRYCPHQGGNSPK